MNRREITLIIVAIAMLVGLLVFRSIGQLRDGRSLPTSPSLTVDRRDELERRLAMLEAEIARLEHEALWREDRYHRVMIVADDGVTARILEDVTGLADRHEVRLLEVSMERVEEWFGLRLAHVNVRWAGTAVNAGTFFSGVIGGPVDWFVDDLAVRRLGDGTVDARMQARIPFSPTPPVTGALHEPHIHVAGGGDEWYPMGPSWAHIFGPPPMNEVTSGPSEESRAPVDVPQVEFVTERQPPPISVIGVAIGERTQAAILMDDLSGETWLMSAGDAVQGWVVVGIDRSGVRMLDPESGTEVLLDVTIDDG